MINYTQVLPCTKFSETKTKNKLINNSDTKSIDLILGDLLQLVFSVISALNIIVQSKLVSLTKKAGF